jgi:hypothetical protein
MYASRPLMAPAMTDWQQPFMIPPPSLAFDIKQAVMRVHLISPTTKARLRFDERLVPLFPSRHDRGVFRFDASVSDFVSHHMTFGELSALDIGRE